MSRFEILGSPVPIEEGTYGSNLLAIDSVEVIDESTAIVNGSKKIHCGFPILEGKDLEWFRLNILVCEEDEICGVNVSPLPPEYVTIRKQFDHEYVYRIQMCFDTNLGEYSDCDADSPMTRDKNTLVEMMKSLGVEHGYFELFCSWEDEEGDPRDESKVLVMTIEELEALDRIRLEDRQYIRIEL